MVAETKPLTLGDRIRLVALVSSSSFTGEGFRASLVTTVESAFAEVLLKKGYNLIGDERTDRHSVGESSAAPTHLLEVTVSEALVEESGSHKFLQVQLSARVVDRAQNQVTMVSSHHKAAAGRHTGELLAIVREVATQLAERFPDLRNRGK